MLSNVLLAHLSELSSSISLSYIYYSKETNIDSLHLQYVIEKLFEVVEKKDLSITQEYITKLKDYSEQVKNLNKTDKYEDMLKQVSIDANKSKRYRRSMGYSQLQMTIAIAKRVLYQRYFIQFYEIDNEEAVLLKALLETTILFLTEFAEIMLDY